MDQSTKSTHLLQVRQGKGIHAAGEYIEVSNNARNIVVIFYSHVSLEKHVMNTCKTAFYHSQNIAKIRNYKYLLLAEFSVRTVNYGPSFGNRWKKNEDL